MEQVQSHEIIVDQRSLEGFAELVFPQNSINSKPQERIPMSLHDRIIRHMWEIHFRTRIRNPNYWAYVDAIKSFDWKMGKSISKHLKSYGIEAFPLTLHEDWGRIFWYVGEDGQNYLDVTYDGDEHQKHIPMYYEDEADREPVDPRIFRF